jgi:uncharacterized membrane protein
LGILLGAAAALSGSLDLTASWLLTSYALVVLLIVNNLYLSLRMRALKALADSANSAALAALSRSRAITASIIGLGLITLALVYTMVAKPTLF